jgi:hypothetical protein
MRILTGIAHITTHDRVRATVRVKLRVQYGHAKREAIHEFAGLAPAQVANILP